MKSPRSLFPPRLRRGRGLVLLAAAVLITDVAPLRAYDPPQIGPGLFSADGIFLAPEDRSSLLEALAAIGSNFPANTRVDNDLREKALALALRLDPLHFNSRVAYRELAKGANPPTTAFFDSLASVSETLWTIGTRLAAPPLDPEEQRLAAYLFELSLLTHPKPPTDRLATFAEVCHRDAPEWEPAVNLQREGNRSTDRAHGLFQEALEHLREQRREAALAKRSEPTSPATPVTTASTTPAPDGAPPRPPRMALPEIEPITLSVATVREVTGVESRPIGGTLSLTLRGPVNGIERALVQETASPNLPVIPSEDNLPLKDFALPKAALQGQTWVEGALAEVAFTPYVTPDGPRRLLEADGALPALVLALCATAKSPVSEQFALLGELDPTGMRVGMTGDALATLAAASTTNRPYLLVPASISESLVAYLQKSNRLEILFQSELIAYTDAADAATRLGAVSDPALTSASTIFNEIREVSLRTDPATRVALQDLARIPSAQEKLRGILASYPAHLSAWAMLEYGTRPVTPEILLSQFSTKVDQIVSPFVVLEESGDAASDLLSLVEPAGSQFLKLRADTPIEARNLLGAAEDLVEAAERYLELTNKTSSIGEQRLREARIAISAFKTEKLRLGLESASSF
ncbi:MAG: hypothetical protein JNJ70_00445 [Verrucomicrobiales bacterium]|nr:hypothetical protein [Verrucomicrobiales bacterium]